MVPCLETELSGVPSARWIGQRSGVGTRHFNQRHKTHVQCRTPSLPTLAGRKRFLGALQSGDDARANLVRAGRQQGSMAVTSEAPMQEGTKT